MACNGVTGHCPRSHVVLVDESSCQSARGSGSSTWALAHESVFLRFAVEGAFTELNGTTYIDHLAHRYGVQPEGALNAFISRHDGQLYLDERVCLNSLAEQYGAPLEVSFLPLITKQIVQMHTYAEAARLAAGYQGSFVYAYATKANFAEEVVRTALQSGAHYETSSAADIIIAHQLWRQGVLRADQYMFCNGSKDLGYRKAILALREAGHEQLISIVDDLDELAYLSSHCQVPMQFGVRVRFDIGDVDPDHPGGERFGLTHSEIDSAVAMLVGTQHSIVMYHAMVGSQIEDAHVWKIQLSSAVDRYAALAHRIPTLRMFNFGGGMPTDSYQLDFQFDCQAFLQTLMSALVDACAQYGTPHPELVGEFGRYTVGSHTVYLMEVGAVKPGRGGAPDWYLLNGSLMVSLPDMLIVEGQQFIVLPLNEWHLPTRPVRLAGRYTCDTDDFYPRPGQPPLLLPNGGEGTILAFFGVGAYQQMLSGRGGAHHCLTPEMRRITIEADGDELVVRETPPQHLSDIMSLLGYNNATLDLGVRRDEQNAERSIVRSFRMPVKRSARMWKRARPI